MNTNHEETCPIWQAAPASSWISDGDDMMRVDSPRAGGQYYIRRDIVLMGLREEYDDDLVKARLTSWLIEQRLLGIKCPRVTEAEIREASERQPLSVTERVDRLLKYFEISTQHLGESFEYDKHRFLGENSDHFLQIMAWSESTRREETDFLVDYLVRREWVEKIMEGQHATYRLTVNGYIHLAELEKTVIDSSKVFVAMWFDPSMESAWQDGIRPAIRNTGYTPKRIDKEEHVDKIDDRIIAEIRRSRFVVADFTHGEKGIRGGVYYEAGFAHGLGISVIFTCRKDLQDEIHFDTRQYNHIFWEAPDELRERLEERIGAVIGQGPGRCQKKYPEHPPAIEQYGFLL